jgi:hypothetical protein
MIKGLYVDTVGVERVKDLVHQNKRVVLVPLYKSFGDFYILQLINYTMGIESGFTYGNFEDYPRVGGLTTDTIGESVARWVERAGFIFSRRNED